jgi:hypothetical protein
MRLLQLLEARIRKIASRDLPQPEVAVEHASLDHQQRQQPASARRYSLQLGDSSSDEDDDDDSDVLREHLRNI